MGSLAGRLRPPLVGIALLLGGCASPRLLRMENDLLAEQSAALRGEVEACRGASPPADFAAVVTLDLIRGYLARVGFDEVRVGPGELLTFTVQGQNTVFDVAVQLFHEEHVLFLSTHRYLSLEAASSSGNMVLLLTQLVSLNYDMLLGKFQLNPRTGDIALSVELYLDDGLGYRSFRTALAHLVRTADDRYPELRRAARGEGL